MKNKVLSTRLAPNGYRVIMTITLMMLFSYAAWAIPPSIVYHPENKTVCLNANATFAITASNTTSYQWQENDGGGFVNITNGGVYSGATSATLTLTGVTAGMTGYLYRCIATGPDNPPATSNSATLTVNIPVSVVTPAVASQTICSGDNASITTVATGTSIGYQWYIHNGVSYVPITNGGVYSGATTSTLTITGITNTNPTAVVIPYFCEISGVCGGVPPQYSYLTVNALPAITGQPVNDTVCAGFTASFKVTATGTALTYQWQTSFNNGATWINLANNATFSNVNTSELLINNPTLGMDNSMYRCVVGGACSPSVASGAATLRVDPLVAIVNHPLDAQVCPGNNHTFSATASGIDVTYQWQVNTGSGWTNITNGGVYSGATTNLLTLTGVPQSFHNNTYRCVAGSKCPGTVVTNLAQLTVPTPLSVVTPAVASQTICSGGNATITTEATGTNVAYQWYIDNGSGYVPLSDGGVYSGTTTSTLSITGIVNNNPTAVTIPYFCSISGACSPISPQYSYLTVNALPTITSQPVSDTLCEGFAASFKVTATGTNLTYQWQTSFNNGVTWMNLANNATFNNVQTSELSISNTTLGMDNSMYRCIVGGACTPSVASSSVKLTVYPLLKIVNHPVNAQVCPGKNHTFSATASGINVTYQWQVNTGSGWTNIINGGVYSGATTAMLTLTGVQLSMNGYTYRCVSTSYCPGIGITNFATLTVPTPVSVVTPAVASQTICSGGNAGITTVANGTGVAYQWYVDNGSGYVPITNGGVYSGATTSTLTITGIINNGPTAVTIPYFCAISGTCGSVSPQYSYLTVNALPTITVQPANDTVCSGFDAFFKVTATGTGLLYQWQVSQNGGTTWANLSNNADYSNVTSAELHINAANTGMHNNQYRCIVSGTCTPSATSSSAVLVVDTEPNITMQPSNSTICTGANASFMVTATGTDLTYQWQVNSGSGWSDIINGGIYSNATTTTLNITGATTTQNNFRYRVIIDGKCGGAIASGEGTLFINTPPSIVNHPSNKAVCPGGNTSFTVMAAGSNLMYQWEVNSGSGWSGISNGGIYSNATTATLNITGASVAENGYMYRCVVNGSCTPPVTTSSATFTINTLPTISAQPANSTICLNGNTSFAVGATGTALTYQWQLSGDATTWSPVFNTGVYSGANTNTLSITGAGTSISGNMYRCVVSGACTPQVISGTAMLTVNLPTVISSQPANVTVCPAANVSFAIQATGSGLTYQWQENTGSSWVDITNGGMYSGATSNQLSLANVQTAHTGYQYRCVVNGLCPVSPNTSSAATLTVHAVVNINSHPDTLITMCSGDDTTLTVGATGTGLSYQWYIHNGTAFVPLSNGGVYSGVTTASLGISNIINAGASAQTIAYYCTVIGTCGGSNTKTTYLTVNALPMVTVQPVNDTACATFGASFKISATGTGRSYQWQMSDDGGVTWSSLVNDTVFKNVTSAEMLLATTADSMDSTMYRCIVTGACAPADTSAAAMLIVNPQLTPAVTIQANNNNVCAGTLISFTATPVNGGVSPSYQWRVNGVNTGFNSSVFTSTSLSHNNIVTCVMTSNAVCATPSLVVSNAVTMNITSYVLPVITVTSSSGNEECSGIPVTFTAASTFGGQTPSYQWQVNGVNVGSDTIVYVTDSLQNGDVVRCILTSSIMCPSQQVVASNNIQMTINQTTPATVSIRTNPDTTVCRGTLVKLFAYYTNSGLNPQFQWMRNGGDIAGETQSTFTTTLLNNGDVIQCRFISSAQCVFPVVSDTLRVKVDNPVNPDVNITVLYNGDESYTFTATPINGGTNPTYKWYVNNALVSGIVGNMYTTSLLNKTDRVHVVMKSNHPCLTVEEATSRKIGTGIGGQNISVNDLQLYPNPNAGRFTITGNYNIDGEVTANITITNALGQVMHKTTTVITGGKLNHTVNLQTSPAPGIYIMRLEIDGRQDVRRFHIAE